MKCDSLKSRLKDYVDQIENEIDLRYESVVDSLVKQYNLNFMFIKENKSSQILLVWIQKSKINRISIRSIV